LVSSGVTLTLEPGVELRAAPGTFIRVDGQLLAIGTAAQPIRLTSNMASPTPGSWGGIFFTPSSADAVVDTDDNYVSGSTLQYATVEWAGIYVEDSFPYFRNLTVQRATTQPNFPYGCCITSGALTAAFPNNPDASKRLIVRDSTFQNNAGLAFGAGGFSGRGVVLFTHNVVTGNGGGLSFGDSGVLDFREIDNTVDGNTGPAFQTRNIGSNARFEGNRVTHNRGGWALYSGSPVVTGNYVADNTNAPAFSGGQPTLTLNTFERNQ